MSHEDANPSPPSVHAYLRALEFIHVFLECVLTGEEDLVVCANTAYEKSLRKYHGWIVRGIFSVRFWK